MSMYLQPVFMRTSHRWTWPIAFIVGLLMSSVFTGLSVGLPLGLTCCTSSSSFTEYENYIGPDFVEPYLYSIVPSKGTHIIDLCQSVCNSDPQCVYFDYVLINNGDIKYCNLYPVSQLSAIVTSNDPTTTSTVYIKNGYSLPNSR